MFCLVYPLRRDGVKLPKAEVLAGEKRGWLTFARMPAGQPVWTATLTGATGANVLPELTCADVKHVERGILIRGLVPLADRTRMGHIRQAWWCVPDPEPPSWSPRTTAAERSGRR